LEVFVNSQNALVFFQGRAYAAELNIHASMPVTDVLKGLDEMGETRFTFVPHGEVSCAGFARFEERRFFLMYFPPKRRQLIWKNKFTNERKAYIVWWPHVYLGIFFRGGAIEDGFAMCAKQKITNTKMMMARLPMPNLSKKYGHVCEGAKGMWDVTARPEDSAYQYADYFFKSEWVSDINDHWNLVPKELWPPGWDFTKTAPNENQIEDVNQKILGIWEAISETDPKAIEKLPWKETFTIDELVKFQWQNKPTMDGHSTITTEQIQQILQGPPQNISITVHGNT
jgi:hypothetical protein